MRIYSGVAVVNYDDLGYACPAEKTDVMKIFRKTQGYTKDWSLSFQPLKIE